MRGILLVVALTIGLQSYPGATKPLTVERLINAYAEQAPATAKVPIYVRRTPGLILRASPPAGVGRGMIVFLGQLYAVVGSKLHHVSSSWAVTERGDLTADSTPAGLTANTSQLVVTSGGDAFIDDGTTFAQVSDPDLRTPVTWTDFLDQIVLFGEANSGRFSWTAIADASDIDALDFATAEGVPDNLLRGIVDHRELLLFGEKSIELWYHTGDADNRFVRRPGGFIERGCGAAYSVCKEDNSVFWLGEDDIQYRLDGLTPIRLSQHGIEGEIKKLAVKSDAVGFFHTWDGHKFYALTFPAARRTFVLDINSQLWHERESLDQGFWRGCFAVKAYGVTLVQDRTTGAIYELSDDAYTENDEMLMWTVRFGPIHADRRRVFMSRFEAEFETGVGLIAGQGAQPVVMLRWSDDGGRTWSSRHQASLGTIGRYRTRAVWTRLGSFYERSIELSVSDPVIATLFGAQAELTVGGT